MLEVFPNTFAHKYLGKQFETNSYWHDPVEEGLAMLMKFAPSLRNTVVEFGFASVLRVSANVSPRVLVGRRVCVFC